MATYDLEEQEQLDELKTWWKMYGNIVTGILVALALAVAGWQGWNWWQRQQAAQASAVFSALQAATAQRDAKRARELAGELIDKYSVTSYAGMGALLSARAQVDAGDAKSARVQLAWAAENARDPGLRDLARLAPGGGDARREGLRRGHQAARRRAGCIIRTAFRGTARRHSGGAGQGRRGAHRLRSRY
jgi:predicted negative regulator of RcsB-dependent stress response